jgi:hypothetical protein
MKESSEHLKNLQQIRSMMEKSSRFISLSGLSGIFAGLYALIGAGIAFWYLNMEGRSQYAYLNNKVDFYIFFFTDAAIVIILALTTGIYFTTRQANKKGQSIWDNTSKRLLINMSVPLAAGGIFCLALLYHEVVGLVAPATLIFYGLALLNASKYTLDDVRYLAFCEIALGLIATFCIGYGLFFWIIGFGVLHIVYGTMMYYKYER